MTRRWTSTTSTIATDETRRRCSRLRSVRRLAGGKKRPAVIVQSDDLNTTLRETVIVEITSNLAHATRRHQVLIDVALPENTASGLLTNSAIRCERLHTIPQVDVLRTLGSLSSTALSEIDSAIKQALGIA